MDVLHYSFSLSACPKCHLLVCKHTSLAELDFQTLEQDQQSTSRNPHARLSSHGMNFYILPSAMSDDRYSWTTFGTNSIESIQTLKDVTIADHERFSENIPFADENVVSTTLTFKPKFNQIVRTQSERCQNKVPPRLCLTRSFSYSTICTTPKSLKSLTLSPHIEHDDHQTNRCCYSHLSLFMAILLVMSYLLTNTLDIVLLYIYYHTDYLCLIIFSSTLLICDLILWINNLMDSGNLSTRLLFIPLILRFYYLYELVELIIAVLNRHWMSQSQSLDSSSTPSSSTSTTLETNVSATTASSFRSHSPPPPRHHRVLVSSKSRKRRLFHSLTLFYLVHSSLLILVNLYFWSNHFQLRGKFLFNMNYYLPQWTPITDEGSLSFLKSLLPTSSSTQVWSAPLNIFYRSVSVNIHLTSSSTFVLISIFYHLIFNYSLLSTILLVHRKSWILIFCILSRACLIITRVYTFLFLIRLHAWWFTVAFLTVHLTFILSLFVDRSTIVQQRRHLFMKFILSLLTHSSSSDISISALISLENISIFLHRLYLETFSTSADVTLRFIIFISVLISFQIVGFLFDLLFQKIFTRTEAKNNVIRTAVV